MNKIVVAAFDVPANALRAFEELVKIKQEPCIIIASGPASATGSNSTEEVEAKAIIARNGGKICK